MVIRLALCLWVTLLLPWSAEAERAAGVLDSPVLALTAAGPPQVLSRGYGLSVVPLPKLPQAAHALERTQQSAAPAMVASMGQNAVDGRAGECPVEVRAVVATEGMAMAVVASSAGSQVVRRNETLAGLGLAHVVKAIDPHQVVLNQGTRKVVCPFSVAGSAD